MTRPYRKEIKDLQVNLFGFIKYLDLDNLEISIPYSRSERIKLVE